MSPESTSGNKNAAPTADFSSPNVTEGYSIPLSLNNPTDPDHPDASPYNDFTYAFDCGDGNGYSSFSYSSSTYCPTADQGKRNVGAKIKDKDGNVTEYRDTVIVRGAAPDLTTFGTYQYAHTGMSKRFNLGTFYDAANDAPWQVTVNWGDGSSSTTFQTKTPGVLTTQHTYADAGTYTVKVKVAETSTEEGGPSFGSDTFQVTVTTFNAGAAAFLSKELKGRVPRYNAYEDDDPRDCPSSADTCFFVETEADNERSLVLIVQDVLQRHSVVTNSDIAVIWFDFSSLEGQGGEAYVFRDEALANHVLSKEELRRAKVIDGVYFVPAQH
jgi:hypothetical protein